MTVSPPPIGADAASDPFLERNARQLAMLQRLAEIGMSMAESLSDREGEPEAVALAFSRIARAVRQTLALEAKLDEERRAFEQEANAFRLRRAADAKTRRRAKQRREIDQVAQCLAEKDDEGPEAQELMADLRAELDYEDLSDGVERSIGEMVRGICAVLGLDFDPDLWGLEAGPNDRPGADQAGAAEAWQPGPGFAGADRVYSRPAPAATGPP